MKKYLIVLALLVISYTLGYYTKPSKVEVRQVEKTVKDTKERGTIIEKETIKPDGSKVITRKIKYEETSKEQTKKETVEKYKALPNNLLSIQHRLDNSVLVPRNTVVYQRRVFSSFYFGGYVDVDKKPGYGLSLTLGF